MGTFPPEGAHVGACPFFASRGPHLARVFLWIAGGPLHAWPALRVRAGRARGANGAARPAGAAVAGRVDAGVTALGVAAHARNPACFPQAACGDGVRRDRQPHAAQSPRNRVPSLHTVPSATSPVSTHVACPFAQDSVPVSHGFASGWHVAPATHSEHAPARHTWLIPQGVPLAIVAGRECREGLPEAQEIVPVWHASPPGLHGAPATQDVGIPESPDASGASEPSRPASGTEASGTAASGTPASRTPADESDSLPASGTAVGPDVTPPHCTNSAAIAVKTAAAKALYRSVIGRPSPSTASGPEEAVVLLWSRRHKS